MKKINTYLLNYKDELMSRKIKKFNETNTEVIKEKMLQNRKKINE